MAKTRRQTICHRIHIALNYEAANIFAGKETLDAVRPLANLQILRQIVFENSAHNWTDNQITTGS